MSEEKKTIATDLASIPSDILEQAKPDTKPAEDKTLKIKVKRLEVREKAEPPAQPESEAKPAEGKPVEAKPAEAKPAETSSLTMAAVEKELGEIKRRLGTVETSQSSAEARLKALEATGESVAKSLAALTDIQTRQSIDLDSIRRQSNDCATVVANMAAEHRTMKAEVDEIKGAQQTIAQAIVTVRQRQTPWGMFQAWRAERRRHAEAERQTMAALRQAEYQASVDAIANGDAKPAEA